MTVNGGAWRVTCWTAPISPRTRGYAHNGNRVRHRAELDQILGHWCAQRDLAEIQRRADDAGIGNARLNGVRDLVEHTQLAARGRWRQVTPRSGPSRRCYRGAGPRLDPRHRVGARPRRGHRNHPRRGQPGARPLTLNAGAGTAQNLTERSGLPLSGHSLEDRREALAAADAHRLKAVPGLPPAHLPRRAWPGCACPWPRPDGPARSPSRAR